MTVDAAGILRELYEAETEKYLDDPARTLLFDPPILAVADASDAWFPRMKEIVGPWHWTAQEALAIVAPEAKARSVICWCLPIHEAIRRSNRGETMYPSRPWAFTRTQADAILKRMSLALAERLRALGHAAASPVHLPRQADDPRPRGALTSRWSLRHVAFIAGLGTFGLSGGLITERGIAHRLGSVVTDAEIPATPRPYGDDPFAWCLRASKGTCGACIKRCPVGSVGESVEARNIPACFNQRETICALGRERYGWEAEHYGCGLCQAGVPCESRNPTSGAKKR